MSLYVLLGQGGAPEGGFPAGACVGSCFLAQWRKKCGLVSAIESEGE